MKIKRISAFAISLSALLLLFSMLMPVAAQEEEDEGEDNGRFGATFAELEMWAAQPSGLDYIPATQLNPLDPFDVKLLSPAYGTESRMRYRGGYKLHKNRGAIVFTWYAHDQETELSGVSPGDFIYGEVLPEPTFAGFGNDGLADAFSSSTKTVLRDLRIDFYRTAFNTKRAKGKWFVGLRRVKHSREMDTAYYALIPALPALIPPLYEPPADGIGLDPQPDTAYMSSHFNGRGLGAGLEVEMPLWKDKLLLEGGLNIAILRGTTDSTYRSRTWYYILEAVGGSTILELPYNEFEQVVDEIPLINSIMQIKSEDGLHVESLPSTAQVLEAELGLRWKAYKGLEWFAGFRSTRYTDVGLDLRAKAAPTYPGSAVDVSKVNRSATYEGFYTGIAYSY